MRRDNCAPTRPCLAARTRILLLVWCLLFVSTRAIRLPGFPPKSKQKPSDDNDADWQELKAQQQQQREESTLLEPLLKLACTLQLVPNTDDEDAIPKKFVLQATCDTGAQRTCMGWTTAKRLGLAHLMDGRYAGQATGVGLCRVLGRIPAQTVRLGFGSGKHTFRVLAPAITVLETSEIELLLGLDFLRDTQAVIDLRNERILLTGKSKGLYQQSHEKRSTTTRTIPVSFVGSPTAVLDEDENGHGSEEDPPRMESWSSNLDTEQAMEGDDNDSDEDLLEESEDDNHAMDMSGL